MNEVAEAVINSQIRSQYTWHHDWMREIRPDLSRSDVAHMSMHSDENVVLCAAACYIKSLTTEELLDCAITHGAENLERIVLRAKWLRDKFFCAPAKRPVWADNEGDGQ